MRFAITWVLDDIVGLSDLVSASEAAGFEAIGIADTQTSVYSELYVAMTLAVRASVRMRVCAMVTNAKTRHWAVTSNALHTLHKLSGGRIACGIGSGFTGVTSAGFRPATRAELSAYVGHLRQDLERRGVARKSLPVLLAVEGPRMATLAGAIADGALFAGDVHPDRIPFYREHHEQGAKSAGRDLGSFEMWGFLRTSIDHDRERAQRIAAPALAAAAGHAYRHGFEGTTLPEHMWAGIDKLRLAYDEVAHNDFRGEENANAQLVMRLGLAEGLADRFGLVGDPASCADRIRQLEKAGLTHLVIRPVTSDPDGFFRHWAEVRSRLDAASAG